MSNSDPSEIALYLIDQVLEDVPPDAHLHRLDLHKLLYLLQSRLSEENLVVEQLPFYWYRHGPVTQAAFDAGDAATRQNIAKAEETDNGTVYLPGPAEPPTPTIDASKDDLSDAVEELSDIVEEYGFHKQRETILKEEIYTDAPYDFQSVFKFQVLPSTQQLARGEAYPSNELISDWHHAEGKLPLDSAFEDFNTQFSRLVSLADTLLADEPASHPLLIAELAELAQTAWKVFCDRLQCETADEYYHSEQKRWERNARQSLATFEKDLGQFEERLHKAGLFDRDVTPATENESWAKVAESILKKS